MKILTSLSSNARLLLLSNVVAFVAFGLTLQYPLLYLNGIRNIPLHDAGIMMSAGSLLGLLITPIAGVWVDRFGARLVLMIGTLASIFMPIAFAQVTSPLTAAIVLTLSSLAQSVRFPAFGTLIGFAVPESQRSGVYSLNYAGLNLGIGLGGLIAGFIVQTGNVASFQMAYYLQAAMTLVSLLLLWRAQETRSAHTSTPAADAIRPIKTDDTNAWRGMLRNSSFVLICLFNLIFWSNVMQQNFFLPLYATRHLGSTPQVLGIGLGLNTLTIALLQLPVLHALRNWRVDRALMAMFGVIILGWCITLFAGQLDHSTLPLVLITLTPGVIGLAETVYSPVLPPLVLKVAPVEQVGRYNGVAGFWGNLASTIVPIIATTFVEADANVPLLGLLIVTCLFAMLLARRFRTI